MEGGVLQAASWTLYEEVAFERDGVTSRDWDSYPILRFSNAPTIEVILIDRPNEPFLGAGEASSGPTAGAIANAVRRATGLRLRRLPFTPEALRRAAAA
jgi:CO/xanthine dehydrogenase Mo-binding subunit